MGITARGGGDFRELGVLKYISYHGGGACSPDIYFIKLHNLVHSGVYFVIILRCSFEKNAERKSKRKVSS